MRKSPSNPPGAAILPSAVAAQRHLLSTARPWSTGRRSPPMSSRAASPPCLPSPTKRRSSRQSGSGATSLGSCTRGTTAEEPPSSSSPAVPQCRVRRRQPMQMAARIGYPRTPCSRSENLVSGCVKRPTLRETLRAKRAGQSRFKRPPGNDGSANRRRPPRVGKEWSRRSFHSPSRRTAALSYSCRSNPSRRREATARS